MYLNFKQRRVKLRTPRFTDQAGNKYVAPWKSKLLQRGRDSPPWWIHHVLGNTLWSKQNVIAQAVRDHERVAVPAAFGVGKTFLAARLALWFLYNFRPAKVITTAPTSRQVKDLLWSELRTAHRQALFPLGGDPLTLQLHVDTDQYAIGFSTKDYNIDYFTGYHSPHQMVVFDQASGLPKIFWEAAEGLMTSAFSRWLAIGNTAIPDGEFANICIPGRKSQFGKWQVIPITALESPNVIAGEELFDGIISSDWVEKRREAWGEDDPLWHIFVLAKFVSSDEMVVLPQKFQDHAWGMEGELDDEDIEIGLDVARKGTDSSVWHARCGSRSIYHARTTGFDLMTLVGKTIELRRMLEKKYSTKKVKREVTRIKVDTIGIGAGVFDRLAELDQPVVDVNNATAAVDNERFLNTRAEMAWTIRDKMQEAQIGLAKCDFDSQESRDRLEEDLRAMRYEINSTGKIKIWEKDKLRQLLGRSPDDWDAFVMSHADPGGDPQLHVLGVDSEGNVVEEEVQGEDEEAIRKAFSTTVPTDDRDWSSYDPDDEDGW